MLERVPLFGVSGLCLVGVLARRHTASESRFALKVWTVIGFFISPLLGVTRDPTLLSYSHLTSIPGA